MPENDEVQPTTEGGEPPAGGGDSLPAETIPPVEPSPPPPDALPGTPASVIDLTKHDPAPSKENGHIEQIQFHGELIDRDPQEEVRGDLARGLLWLLTLMIGGVLLFVGTGKIKSEVLTQSIFPSLVTLTGTALGFYFGSQSSKDKNKPGT